MHSITNRKSTSYLKSHAAQIAEDLALNDNTFFITQNGEASQVIESVKQFQEKEALIAALKSSPWVKKTGYKGRAFRLLIHGRSCWLLVKAKNNDRRHSSRCTT